MLRIGVAAAAYALTLLVAALLLGKFEINAGPFILAVAIFTAAIVFLKPVIEKFAGQYAHGATWVVGLATTWVALLITDLTTSGIEIEGFWTWVLAVVIVWVGTLVYDIVDDKAIATVERTVKGITDQGPPAA